MFTKKNIEKKYKQLSGIKKQFRFQKQYFDPQNVINIFFQIFFLLKNFLQWRSWTRTLDFVLEKLVFIIFLKTLDEIAVHFSSQDVFDIWIFYLMTEGKQEDKKHWFFRTGNCTPVWRKDGIKAIWNIIGIASFSNSFQPKKALIKFTDKCQ